MGDLPQRPAHRNATGNLFAFLKPQCCHRFWSAGGRTPTPAEQIAGIELVAFEAPEEPAQCTAALSTLILFSPCPLWVISRHEVVNSRCLLYPGEFNWSMQHLLILRDGEVCDGVTCTDKVHGQSEG